MLLGTYTIPKTGVREGGVICMFRGTIPGSILPAGDVIVVVGDPGSGVERRIQVRILENGEIYKEYRNRQVTEGIFYPATTGLIRVLIVLLGHLVVERR